MATREKEHYSLFRKLFYPNGTKDQQQFDLLSHLISEGYTDQMIATYFGVTRMTIGNWKRSHPEILECFTENKATPDDKVERALFERATGYDMVETKVNVFEGTVILTDVIKRVPPDTTAGIYWLNNRRPQKWKSVVHSKNEDVEVEPVVDYSVYTPEELDVLEKLLAKGRPATPIEPEE